MDLENRNKYICYLQETHFTLKDTHKQSKGIEKYLSWNKKKDGIAILI